MVFINTVLPDEQDTLRQCWHNVGPASSAFGSTSRGYMVCTRVALVQMEQWKSVQLIYLCKLNQTCPTSVVTV